MTELRIDYAFIEGGEHRLKNVSRPMHVFHVRQARVQPPRRRNRHRR